MFSGNEALYISILKEFVDECQDNLTDIEEALDSFDIQKAFAASHKLKGTASNIYVTQVTQKSKALELALRNIDNPSSEASQSELKTLYKELKKVADEFILSVSSTC